MTRPMMLATLLATSLLLISASLAAAARPPADTKYRGKTSQGRVINLAVSKSGTGLEIRNREEFGCKGIRDQVATATYKKDRPTIKADGTYTYRKRYSGLRASGLPGVFSETQRLSGRFSADLSRVRGRSFARIFGSRFACRSGLTFTATRIR